MTRTISKSGKIAVKNDHKKKKGANLELANSTILFGTPGAIRTRGTRIRNPLLYPTELQGRMMSMMIRGRAL